MRKSGKRTPVQSTPVGKINDKFVYKYQTSILERIGAISGLVSRWVVYLLLCFSTVTWGQKGQFLSADEFRTQAFPGHSPAMQTLWLTQSLREAAERILKHSYHGLRLRYWGQGQRTAWIIEEIGKELPITIGVIVEQNSIHGISILAFRESRGGEVRYPFFTRQFSQLGLLQKRDGYALDGPVDGITGATLSVRAIKKVATLALFFHRQTPFASEDK